LAGVIAAEMLQAGRQLRADTTIDVVNALTLAAEFKQTFRVWPRVFSAPGRINLIGEHTDYNDGFVLPIAINRRTYIAAAAGHNTRVRALAVDLNDFGEFDLREQRIEAEKRWLSYVAGTTWIIQRQYPSLRGVDLAIGSNVPMGGGLSSSAALEVATGKAITALSEIDPPPLALALYAQEAENTFVGARVGIMDQLAATFGKRGHAMLIDCRSLEMRRIPIHKVEAAIVVCNTNVKHELASSAYNQRRKECEIAVAILKQKMPAITSLRDVSLGDYRRVADDLPEPVRRRARHVVTENARTLQGAAALERGDLQEMGSLMKSSHESLRDDYEVSCPELDTIVELAWSYEGVFGARLTGGGFGGCSVNLVAHDRVNDFVAFIRERYERATRKLADVFVVDADDGVREELVVE
jgi:galactokinase